MVESLKKVLAENLSFIMRARGLSEQALSDRTGNEIAQKTINNLKNAKQSATLDTIEILASALRIDAALLLQSGLAADFENTPSISTLFKNYTQSSGEGQLTIQRVAETEAQYRPKKAG